MSDDAIILSLREQLGVGYVPTSKENDIPYSFYETARDSSFPARRSARVLAFKWN